MVDILEELTTQSMPGAFLPSAMESELDKSPTEEPIAESPLLWFLSLDWLNENWRLIGGDSSTTANGEEDPNTASSASGALRRSPSPNGLPPVTSVSCLICMDDFPEPEALPIPYCRHPFCRDCLSVYVRGKLREGRYPIQCPTCSTENKTDVYVTEGILEQLDLSEDDLDKLVEAQLSTHAISLSCIRCKQTMRVDREEYHELNVIMCPLPRCQHRWCKFCRKEVGPCDTAHRCKNWRLDGLLWRKGWKSCPGCGVIVERISGCNHMTCAAPGCFVHFCYRCGQLIIDPSKGGHVGAAITNHYSRCHQHQRRLIPGRIRRACTIQ